MDDTASPIYSCPMCGLDTPHKVSGQRGEVCAVRCTNCGNGSLVHNDELNLYQVRWEEELREILASLERPGE